MATTAKGTVYGRQEGSGFAQAFPAKTNPIQVLLNQKRNKLYQDVAQRKEDDKAKLARQKKMDEYMDFAPEKSWEPFDRQLKDHVQKNVRDYVSESFKNGVDFYDGNFNNEVKRRHDESNLIASKSRQLKELNDDIKSKINSEDHYDTKYYEEKLFDYLYNNDGSAKDISSLNPKALENFFDDPQGSRVDVMSETLVKSLPEISQKDFEFKKNQFGTFAEVEDIRGRIFNDGKIEFDKNDNPIINVGPDLVRMVRKNEEYRDWLDFAKAGLDPRYPEFKGRTDEAILNETLRPYAGIKKAETVSGFRKTGEGDIDENDITLRDEQIRALQQPWGPRGADTEINPAAQKALGFIMSNAKYQGNQILNAEFVRADENNPDKLVLTVKSGQVAGEEIPKTIEIDLSDPNTYEIFNGMLNTSSSIQKKISFDKLVDQNRSTKRKLGFTQPQQDQEEELEVQF